MAKLPEQYERERNGGLGRYRTEEYGILALDAMHLGFEVAERKRNSMIMLEALHARNFKYDSYRQVYYNNVVIVDSKGRDTGKRYNMEVDAHIVRDGAYKNMYRELDSRLEDMQGVWDYVEPKPEPPKITDHGDYFTIEGRETQ